jgi:hypothetical protein
MIMRKPTIIALTALAMWAFVLGIGTQGTPARGLDLGGSFGDLVKIFGIGWAVSHYGDQIDNAINGILQQHDAKVEGLTKVVPVLAVGHGGTAIGAVQVMGPPDQVKQVQAVAEIQVAMDRLRGRGLVPISTKSAGASSTSLKAVNGVGVSANIKFPL